MTQPQVLWKPFELRFKSESHYSNPYLDVELTLKFTSPSGKQIWIQGFWDGGNCWKARFAANEEGFWKWESEATPSDPGLHEKTGSFIVVRSSGKNPINEHGFLRIHPSQRSFMHADGVPFFWLGDTGWSIPSVANLEELTFYLQTRRRQGFNIIQMNSLPQHDSSSKEYRKPFITEHSQWDLDRPQPEYFQMLDTLLNQCLEAGILPALVVLWFDYVPETNVWWKLQKKAVFSPDQAARYARYLVARTSAFGTIYIITGDSDFETSESAAVYDAAGNAVRESNPHNTPISAHINGEIMTPQLLNQRTWLDFHMYQSGHGHSSLQRSSACAIHAAHLHPVRPVLNSEPMYDHRYYLEPEKKSPERCQLRRIYWTSWFSGATAGLTYGAHGIWSWDRKPLEPDWRSLLSLESANDAVRLKEFLEQYPWWQFRPAPKIPLDPDLHCAIARDAGILMIYLAKPAGQVVLNLRFIPAAGVWYNPETGETFAAKYQTTDDGLMVDSSGWKTDQILVLNIPDLKYITEGEIL